MRITTMIPLCLCGNVAWRIWFSHLRYGAARTLPIPSQIFHQADGASQLAVGDRYTSTMELLKLGGAILVVPVKDFIFQ
jgi:hypothetical protein